jgi:hypothetical protein
MQMSVSMVGVDPRGYTLGSSTADQFIVWALPSSLCFRSAASMLMQIPPRHWGDDYFITTNNSSLRQLLVVLDRCLYGLSSLWHSIVLSLSSVN